MYSVTKLLLLLACLLLLQFEYLLQSDRPSESSQYHRLTLALCRQTPPLRLCKSFSHCMAPAQLLSNPSHAGILCEPNEQQALCMYLSMFLPQNCCIRPEPECTTSASLNAQGST